MTITWKILLNVHGLYNTRIFLPKLCFSLLRIHRYYKKYFYASSAMMKKCNKFPTNDAVW